MLNGFVDLRRLSKCLCISARTLRECVMRPDDPLPAHRIGGKLLFRWSEVQEWIERHRVQTTNVESIIDDLSRYTEGAE